MAKRESLVWQYFNVLPKTESTSNYKIGSCKFCGINYVSNASRMERHLVFKCKTALANVKSLFSNNLMEVDDSATDNDEVNPRCVENAGSSAPLPQCQVARSHGANMNCFIDTMPVATKEKLDAAFARAVYASAAPLSMTENIYWQEFFKLLRPAYTLPSRHHLSKPLLDVEHDLIHSEITKKIQSADSLTIMSDGWTDINGTSLVNILFSTPQPVFWSAIQTKDNSCTATYISHILGQAIHEVGEDKVHGLVTDNAANMKAAWALLEQRFPHIITYGCAAHGINLVIKDIVSIPSVKDILNSVNDVVNFFRNRHMAKEVLIKIQLQQYKKAIALLRPVETRWGSYFQTLSSLLHSRNALQISIHYEEIISIIPAGIRRNISDNDHFWKMVQNLHDLLKEPSNLIRDIEGDHPNLSYFTIRTRKMFDFLNNSLYFLSAEEEDLLKQKFVDRQEFLSHPVQLAAYLLNPKCRDNPLDEADEQAAINFIHQRAELLKLDVTKIGVDLCEYIGKSSIWANDKIWDAVPNMDPVVWWKGYCSRRELTKIAVIFLSLPCTSAACERSWSTYSSVKTKKRNRLEVVRATKLVSIKYNLRLLAPQKNKPKKRVEIGENVPLNHRCSDKSSDEYEDEEWLDDIWNGDEWANDNSPSAA